AEDKKVLEQLAGIDRALLPPDEQLNYDLFARQYRLAVEGYQYQTYLIPINQRGGIQAVSENAELIRFDEERDYRDWLTRLNSFDTYMDQTITLLREGIKTGMV